MKRKTPEQKANRRYRLRRADGWSKVDAAAFRELEASIGLWANPRQLIPAAGLEKADRAPHWWDLTAWKHDPPADGVRWHTKPRCLHRDYRPGGPGRNAMLCVVCFPRPRVAWKRPPRTRAVRRAKAKALGWVP